VCYAVSMNRKKTIEQILVLSHLLDKPRGELNWKSLSEKSDSELMILISGLRNMHDAITSISAHKYNVKVRTEANPLRDAALEAYKSFADKDENPIDLDNITETRVGDLYNCIWFDKIKEVLNITRSSTIDVDGILGLFMVQITNDFDLSSMKEEEIHPFLTKLFLNFLELVESFKGMIIGDVVNAMKEKITNNKSSLYLQTNDQPSFVITILPKKDVTEIYLDYDVIHKYGTQSHIRDKFTLNNSTQELMFNNKPVSEQSMKKYISSRK